MQHESKQCHRCKQYFECKPLNIMDCQCTQIQLNDAERAFIKISFDDCLCLDCLKELKQEFYTDQFHAKIKHTPLG
jgi:hypothetical protein